MVSRKAVAISVASLAIVGVAYLGLPPILVTLTGGASTVTSTVPPQTSIVTPLTTTAPQITTGTTAVSRTTAPRTIDYEALLTRKDKGEGGVMIEATLMTREYLAFKNENLSQNDLNTSIIFRVTVDTHAGSLLEYDFRELSFLRDDKNRTYSAIEWKDVALDAHHRSGILRFSATDRAGKSIVTDETRYIELLMRNIAKVPERALRWELPIRY